MSHNSTTATQRDKNISNEPFGRESLHDTFLLPEKFSNFPFTRGVISSPPIDEKISKNDIMLKNNSCCNKDSVNKNLYLESLKKTNYDLYALLRSYKDPVLLNFGEIIDPDQWSELVMDPELDDLLKPLSQKLSFTIQNCDTGFATPLILSLIHI